MLLSDKPPVLTPEPNTKDDICITSYILLIVNIVVIYRLCNTV